MDKRIRRLIEEVVMQARLSPFSDFNLTVPVEVIVQRHGVAIDKTKVIHWVWLAADLEQPSLIADARLSFESLDDDIDEVWHSDCPVADTGLLADKQGAISRLIDFLRVGLGWTNQVPSLDKIILSRNASTEVSGFHTDHFPFGTKTYRSQGSANRVILNLGFETRVVCFLLPDREEELSLGDEYCLDDYRRLGDTLKGARLIITLLPGYSKSTGIAGVKFDAHNVLHSGLPHAGSMVAVLTDWTDNENLE